MCRVTLLRIDLLTAPYADDLSGITVLLLDARMPGASSKIAATCEIRDCNNDILRVSGLHH
jgi:hypothetical protein